MSRGILKREIIRKKAVEEKLLKEIKARKMNGEIGSLTLKMESQVGAGGKGWDQNIIAGDLWMWYSVVACRIQDFSCHFIYGA